MATSLRLPSNPPRSSRYGRNPRESIARLACLLLASCPDPSKTLVRGVREASKGECGVREMEFDGQPEVMINAASVVALVAHKAGIDIADPHQSEAFLEYAQKCLDHYRGQAV